jgi:hypothetical protein
MTVTVTKTEFTKISDHRPLVWEIHIPQHKNRQLKRTTINKSSAAAKMKNIIENLPIQDDPWNTLNMMRETLEEQRGEIVKTISTRYARKYDISKLKERITLNDEQYVSFLQKEWRQMVYAMEDMRPKNKTKAFFDKLHSFSLYDQLEKRDGSVVSVIRKEDGNLETDREEIDKALIQVLREVHGEMEEIQYNSGLPRLSIEKTEKIMGTMSRDKGLSDDLISDTLPHAKRGYFDLSISFMGNTAQPIPSCPL